MRTKRDRIEEVLAEALPHVAPAILAGAAERLAQMTVEQAETMREAEIDARAALEHDDSEWADRKRGYGSDSHTCGRNEAGEWRGFM